MRQAFDERAEAWLRYGESAGGRLRHAVILHHLRAHIGHAPLEILDVGGGTGELLADLARDGDVLTLLDFSPVMLELARQRCSGPSFRLVCMAAGECLDLFGASSFDLVLCHSLLEFVDEPAQLLAQVAALVREGGLLSVVAGNRYHPVMRAALQERDFSRARQGLEIELEATDLFGLPQRAFFPEVVRGMLDACEMHLVGEYGVRVFFDLLVDRPEISAELLELELAASPRMPYRHLARFIQYLARKGNS